MPARYVYLAASILAAAGVYSAWCGAAMTWDGAYQFAHTLIARRPYVYETRFHSFLLWQPVVWVDRFTDNLTLLKAVYGLPYLLAPSASLLLSWWLVRRRAPHLVIWAVFGVAVAPLPGQVFVINDSIFQQHLFWPVFLGLIAPGPLTRAQRVALGLLAAFQLSHQIGCVLMAGAAIATGLLAAADRGERKQLLRRGAFAAAVAALALVKMWVYYDPYAAQEFTWESARQRWQAGVAGAPLVGLALMWVAGVAVTVEARGGDRLRHTIRALSLVLVIATGAVWVAWATDFHHWAWASEYRRWLVPLTLPFYAMALLDRIRPAATHTPTAPPPAPLRGTLAPLLAGVFAAVLGVQGAVWSALSRRLADDLRAYPQAVVPASALPWVEHTPFQHWSLPAQGVVLQGREPRKLIVLDPKDEATLRHTPPGIPLAPGESRVPEPGPGGWFDFRPLIEYVSGEP